MHSTEAQLQETPASSRSGAGAARPRLGLAPALEAVDLPPECGVEVILRVLTGKWSVLVVRELLHGPRRFGQLLTALAPVAPKTLTDRLRSFEKHGIVHRVAFAEIPPRVVYQLTPLGSTLVTVLNVMDAWGREHGPELLGGSA